MRTKRLIFIAATAVTLALAGSGIVEATAPSGVVGTTFSVGQFGPIHAKTLGEDWQARIDTKGTSDVYVLENKIAPGGSFGWHSHPGPSIVTVKSGTLWVYKGDDPTCTPEVVEAGHGFVDDGHDTHLVRNEGTVETDVFVVSIVPTGEPRRIDEPAPGNCPF